MDVATLIVSLIGGVFGGNAASTLMKDHRLKALGNSLAGLAGGAVGGWLLKVLVHPSLETVVGLIVSGVAGGGLCGGIAVAIAGVFWKKAGSG